MNGGARLVVLDLSNLCRDARLLDAGVAADLSLLDRFTAALDELGLGAAAVYSVADRSLLPLLSPADRRRARDMQGDGRLETSAVADERLLDMAFGHDAAAHALVASLDNFDDFRRMYPAIQGCTDRFIGWEPSGDGLVVHWRDMGVHGHRRLSRKEESAQLKERRLRRTSIVERAVATYFRCHSDSCILAQLWPDRLPDLPRYDDAKDTFICPSCMDPLEVGANRPAAAQVIVFLRGAEQFRILLEQGDGVVLGRRDASGCIGLASRLPAGAADAVGRRHLRLYLENRDVFVEELGSRNGSAYRRRGLDRQLEQGDRVMLSHDATVALPEGITVERSGRALPFAGERPRADGGGDDGASTRLLTTGARSRGRS